MRILIAEDETIIRLDLRELLEKARLRGRRRGTDGEEAVALARSERARPRAARREDAEARRDRRRPADPRRAADPDRDGDGLRRAGARLAGGRGRRVRLPREAVSRVRPAARDRDGARAARRAHRAPRGGGRRLADALAARKAIERAKGLLMEREGLTEQDAFARLRKASQISGRPLKVVAEALIATLDVKAAKTGADGAAEALPARLTGPGRGEQPLVLAAPARAPARPDGRGDERERRCGDDERERDDGLPGEDLDRRSSARSSREPGTTAPLPCSVCSSAGSSRSAPRRRWRRGSRGARGAGPAPRAPLEQTRALGRGRRPRGGRSARRSARGASRPRGRGRRATPGGRRSGRSAPRSCRARRGA